MMHTQIFKASISLALILGGLTGCYSADNLEPADTETRMSATATANLPPIRKTLSCLPPEAAILAAHRGTDKAWNDIAENSLTSLKKLIDHGTQMAEIDVAGIKGGTLISFHDGVWEEISTGKGPIASTTPDELDKILLRSRAGELTADRPPLFDDILTLVKGKMYLEVDFKSSANRPAVIQAIRDADMADQVLLIAYTPEAAAELDQLAPEMLRSNPRERVERDHAIWLGYGVGEGDTAKTLKMNGSYVIGRIGDPKRQPPLSTLQTAAHILVTDNAERYPAILGLTDKSRAAYEACLVE